MEPITHFMTGACLARSGLNRKAAYATLTMTLAAQAPDVDTLWSLRGPVAGFQHHRGITHTFLALPVEAIAIVGAIWLLHRYRLYRVRIRPVPADTIPHLITDTTVARPLTAVPVHWPRLYAFTLLALLSHLLLDWTNNYGVRPFFPFNPRWYAGSIVFVFEPLLFAVLFLALALPSLFGLIAGEVGARRQNFRGRGFALFALVFMLALWGWRQFEHDAALRLASTAVYGPTGTGDPPPEVLRISVSPYPVNPYRWHAVVETPGFFQLATIDTRAGTVSTNPAEDIFPRPASTVAALVAKRSYLGHVYLDWSSWPIVTDTGPAAVLPDGSDPTNLTAVTFRDLRFMYDVPFLRGRQDPPISGTVYINLSQPDASRVAAIEFNGRMQKPERVGMF